MEPYSDQPKNQKRDYKATKSQKQIEKAAQRSGKKKNRQRAKKLISDILNNDKTSF